MSTPNPDPSFEADAPNVSAGQNGASFPAAGEESTSLSLWPQSSETGNQAGNQARSSRAGAETGFDQNKNLSAAHPDAAEESSLREFYAQLTTLLTQDNAPQAKKKSRNTLLSALRRRWFPALLVSAIAFAGLTSLLRPRQSVYDSSVMLLLPPRIVGSSQNQDPFTPPEESYDTEAELAIIGSESIVTKAMSQVPPMLRLRGWGNTNVTAAPVQAVAYGSDSLININVSSLDPAASLRLADEMVSAYTDYTRRRYEQNRTENLKITEERVTESGQLLESARNQLRRFKERSGVFDAALQQGTSSGSVGDLENALAKAKSEAGGTSNDGVRDAGLDLLRQQALEAQIAYQNVVRDFLPSSDRARAAERKWRQIAAQARAREREIRTANARRRAQIGASLRVARSRAAALPAIEQTLNRLNERVQLLQTAYRSASDRFNQLNLARGTVAPTAKVLRSPSVGSTRRTQWIRALAVSVLASLGLGLLGAWFFNRLDHSVRTISDPDEFFEVPILGVMPATGGKSGVQLSGILVKQGRSTLQTATIEACYTTQNNLLGAAKAFDARSILLTSALPGEGKSQCASNLATAMAYGGQKVLLIDADFLHPTQHDNLKMSLEPGYAQVLQNEIALPAAVRPTSISNLHLLSAGKNVLQKPEDLVAWLGGSQHQQNLRELEKHYEVILIDGPPTMSMADAQLLGNMADSVVLVTSEKTHQEEVYRARSMLRLAGGLLLGVIVNSVSLREMGDWNLNFTAETPFSNYAQSLRQRTH